VFKNFRFCCSGVKAYSGRDVTNIAVDYITNCSGH